MKQRGFTIIELVIVMAVIAILITVGMAYFRGLQDEAKKTQALGDLRALQIAVESYYKNNNQYPIATTTGSTNWQ
ncbi:MAG: prepilin-type N-terminal cleavage/methylation domain-containing protein, partial [bacterium]